MPSCSRSDLITSHKRLPDADSSHKSDFFSNSNHLYAAQTSDNASIVVVAAAAHVFFKPVCNLRGSLFSPLELGENPNFPG